MMILNNILRAVVNSKYHKSIPVQFLKDGTSCHELFIKEHSLRHHEENKPPGRTLFVLNIPPYVTEDSLRKLFSSVGKVTAVYLQHSITNEYDSPNGFKVGYVVFAKREGLLKTLQINNLSLNDLPFKTGLDKWIQEYNESICDPELLSHEINSFMLKYDKSEEENKKKSKDVDNEGWTVVTKKGRNPGLARKRSVEIKINEKIKTGSTKKELKNFYTFQIRESKMKNLAVLRKNFEEAKKKVDIMKNSRRFKPY